MITVMFVDKKREMQILCKMQIYTDFPDDLKITSKFL